MDNITLEQVSDYIIKLSTLLGAIIFILSFILKETKKQFDKNIKEAIEPLYQGLQCCMRNDILLVYLMRRKDKRITIEEKKAINYSFETYALIGGNSFVKDIVKEMNEWEIID